MSSFALGQYNLSKQTTSKQPASLSSLFSSPTLNASPIDKQHIKSDGKVDLSNYFEYLLEGSEALQLEDVKQDRNRSRWRHTSPNGLSFGNEKRALWLRVKIYNPLDTEQHRVVTMSLPVLESVNGYLQRQQHPRATGMQEVRDGGESTRLELMPSMPRNIQIPVTIAANQELLFYFRIKPVAALNFSAVLWDSQTFRDNLIFNYGARSFGLGLIFAVFFFSLVKFQRRYDPMFGYLMAYLAGLSLLLLTFSGFVSSSVAPGNNTLENSLLLWSLFISTGSAVLFSRCILLSGRQNRASSQLAMLIIGISLLGVLSGFVVSMRLSLIIMLFAQISFSIIAVITGAMLSMRKNATAVFYTAAWSLMFCVMILFSASFVVGIDPSWPLQNAVYAGATLHAVLLALAVLEKEQSKFKQRQRLQLDALMNARLSDQRHSEALESERMARVARQAELENQINTNQALERRVLHLSRELTKSYRELQRLSEIDAITGLRNRNFYLCNLAESIDEYLQNNQVFAVLLIDFDLPESIADRSEPECAEECLRNVGHTLQRLLPSVREADFSHIGGERFAVLLHGIDCQQINSIAQRLFRDLSVIEFVFAGKHCEITISVGAACVESFVSPTPELLLRAAERALKASKNLGEHQVCAEVFGSA